jgi:hypothetical protein
MPSGRCCTELQKDAVMLRHHSGDQSSRMRKVKRRVAVAAAGDALSKRRYSGAPGQPGVKTLYFCVRAGAMDMPDSASQAAVSAVYL